MPREVRGVEVVRYREEKGDAPTGGGIDAWGVRFEMLAVELEVLLEGCVLPRLAELSKGLGPVALGFDLQHAGKVL